MYQEPYHPLLFLSLLVSNRSTPYLKSLERKKKTSPGSADLQSSSPSSGKYTAFDDANQKETCRFPPSMWRDSRQSNSLARVHIHMKDRRARHYSSMVSRVHGSDRE